MAKAPAFTGPSALTIALGIGASTAVFSLVYAVLLRPFPYPDVDRIVRVFTVAEEEQGAERNCSLLDIEEYNRPRARSRTWEGTWFSIRRSQAKAEPSRCDRAAQPRGAPCRRRATGLGRLFAAEEDRKGGPVNKALLSHGLWQARYGGSRDVLGLMIHLPSGGYEVIGVMPPGYGFPDRATVWLTMESWYALDLDLYRTKQRDQRWYPTVARLAPGVTLEQAQQEVLAVARQLAEEFPSTNAGVDVRLVRLRDAEVGTVEPYLYLLAGGVGFLLLICILNVTNLLLVRLLAREKQYVIQAALGAGRFELAKGLLAESLMLTLAGGVAGALIAWVSVSGFRTLLPDSLPAWMHIEVDSLRTRVLLRGHAGGRDRARVRPVGHRFTRQPGGCAE